jgi:hypothetical protein
MKLKSYVYVLMERYPKSGTLSLHQWHPSMAFATEAEAQAAMKEMRQLIGDNSGRVDPIDTMYVQIPLMEL